MKLFFRDRYLGDVNDIYFDQPEVHGTFTPSPAADAFRDFFRWMVDEDNFSKEPPFADDLLDDDNWFVMDDDGERRPISLPALHEDREIIWRWRR